MKISVPGCFAAFDGMPIDVVNRIRSGLPSSLVDDVAAFLGLRLEMLTDNLGLSAMSVRQRAQCGGTLENWEAGRLCWVAQAYFESASLFESEQGAVEWLRERVPALGNVAPLSLFDTPAGYQLVIDTLGQIKYGVFA